MKLDRARVHYLQKGMTSQIWKTMVLYMSANMKRPSSW